VRRRHALTTFAGLLLALTPATASVAAQEETGTDTDDSFLRIVESPGDSLALDVAARTYTPADGEGPRVALVGVAHIGEKALYTDLQELLDGFDVVLYESVKPAGAGRPSGETDEARAESTRHAMEFVAGVVELAHAELGSYPLDAEALVASAKKVDPRISQWTALALVDAWGEPLRYEVEEGGGFVLRSFGADGEPGGEGHAADISVDDESTEPLALGEDGIQAQLADALGLEFQLTAMDYGHDNWRCSDVTLDELASALAERGIDFGPIGGSLAGSSLTAKVAGGILKLVRVLDAMIDGLVSDMAKVMMIELLGNEEFTEKAIEQQFGGEFAEVLVNHRNDVVIADLKRLIDEEPDVESVAIFYGAAHMPDFVRQLKELGYESESVEWTTAMEVDLRNSAMSESEIRMIRRMILQQMRMMQGG